MVGTGDRARTSWLASNAERTKGASDGRRGLYRGRLARAGHARRRRGPRWEGCRRPGRRGARRPSTLDNRPPLSRVASRDSLPGAAACGPIRPQRPHAIGQQAEDYPAAAAPRTGGTMSLRAGLRPNLAVGLHWATTFKADGRRDWPPSACVCMACCYCTSPVWWTLAGYYNRKYGSMLQESMYRICLTLAPKSMSRLHPS